MIDNVFSALQDLARSFQERLNVQTVYGEPVTANNITIVPAGRVSFGFGGGGGGGSGEQPAEGVGGSVETKGGSGGGGGGGGGGTVQPLGYIEISDAGSRWVPIERPRSEQLIKGAAALAAALPILGRRRGLLARGALLVVALVFVSQLFTARRPSMPPGINART